MAPPDLILHGGTIHTLDGSSRSASALAVARGSVAAVGSDAQILASRGRDTRLIDLAGRTLTPGFFDAHPHLDRHGLKALGGVPIAHCTSIAEIVDVVRETAARTPTGEWIVVMPMGAPPENYVYRADQLREGVPVALSTDGVPHSMLFALWEALARWDNDSKMQLGESGLTREPALRLATVAGHVLTWDEDRRGPLEPGKAADFVVLEDDPLTCTLEAIRDIPVLRTFVGGRQVHGPA